MKTTEKQRAEWARIYGGRSYDDWQAAILQAHTAVPALLAERDELERERDAYAETIRNFAIEVRWDGNPRPRNGVQCLLCYRRASDEEKKAGLGWHDSDCPALPALRAAEVAS